MNDTKTCPQCNAEKPLTDFPVKDASRRRVLRTPRCRECEKARGRKWKADMVARRQPAPPADGP